jgi:hypothetical protein
MGPKAAANHSPEVTPQRGKVFGWHVVHSRIGDLNVTMHNSFSETTGYAN